MTTPHPRSSCTTATRLTAIAALLLTVGVGTGCNSVREMNHVEEMAQAEPEETWQQYAVKYVCGEQPTQPQILSRGRYFTAVNVHNPRLDRPLDFLFKVAVAEPGLMTGPISGFMQVPLRADGALEIDCPRIMEKVGAETFSKGFVVLLSRDELDVVAVYTAGPEPAAVDEIHALHVEPVAPRPIANALAFTDPDPDDDTPMSCAGAGCCCNSPVSQSNPGAGQWPGCGSGFECRALEPGGILHPTAGRIDVNVCVQTGASPLAVPFLSTTQPSYCRVDVQ